MKIRNGFVSNSSSSSFLIFMKSEPTKENFLKLLGVSGSIGEGIGEMFDYFIRQKYSEFVKDEESFTKFLEDREWDVSHPDSYGYKQARIIRNILNSDFSFIYTNLSDNEDYKEMAYNGFLTVISHNNRDIRQIDEDLYVIKEHF